MAFEGYESVGVAGSIGGTWLLAPSKIKYVVS